MKKSRLAVVAWLACVCVWAGAAAAQSVAEQFTLTRIFPADAQTGMVWRHSGERDLQRQHLARVFETFQQEQILEQAIEIVAERFGEEKMGPADQILQVTRQAAASPCVEALLNAQEIAFFQVTAQGTAQTTLAIKMTPAAVEECFAKAEQMIQMASAAGDGKVDIETEQLDGARLIAVALPDPAPVKPTLIAVGDVLLVSTSGENARAAAAALTGGGAASKFDEERMVAAIAALPPAEDLIHFYDGKLHIEKLREQLAPVVESLRVQSDGDPSIAAGARLMEAMLSEIEVSDIEVSVGFTEEGNNHSATYGSLLPGSDGRLVRMLVEGNEPFADWTRWTPADAVAFRLSAGFDLHAAYLQAMEIFSREAPEIAAQALVKLAEAEDKLGLSLEDDLISLFSGETVSLTLADGSSVAAARCDQPERAGELLHRLVDTLRQIPQVADQQLELVPCDALEGFEELRASPLAALGARPVIGFHEGWLIVGTTPAAAQSLLDVRWGDADSFVATDAYRRLGMEVSGPVSSISYTDTAASIRKAAQMLNQGAAIAPLMLQPLLKDADPADADAIRKALGLVPRIARVVQQFDFLEAQFSVQQPGDQADTYRKQCVQLIRQQ